jgi:hypothetical protein
MSNEAIKFYAEKFFPHLLLPHAIECVRVILADFEKKRHVRHIPQAAELHHLRKRG